LRVKRENYPNYARNPLFPPPYKERLGNFLTFLRDTLEKMHRYGREKP
jgi:hypothetical protein